MVESVLRKRQAQRKAARLARALVELDEVARERRRRPPRRTLRASLGGAR